VPQQRAAACQKNGAVEADVGEHVIVETEEHHRVSTGAPVVAASRDQALDRLQQPGKSGPNRGGAGMCRRIECDAHDCSPLDDALQAASRAVCHRDGASAFRGAFQQTWISRRPTVDSSLGATTSSDPRSPNVRRNASVSLIAVRVTAVTGFFNAETIRQCAIRRIATR